MRRYAFAEQDGPVIASTQADRNYRVGSSQLRSCGRLSRELPNTQAGPRRHYDLGATDSAAKRQNQTITLLAAVRQSGSICDHLVLCNASNIDGRRR